MIHKLIKKCIDLIKYAFLVVRLFFRRWFFKKNIWFITTPIYDNIGDYAIVFAQYKILRDAGLEKYVIDLSRREYERLNKKIDFFVKKKDLIIIDGGGNIGTLWPEEENRIRGIINRFHENPIFIFPQTAYFEDSESGRNELIKSKEIYNSHPHLTVFCRDIDTYNLFSTKFNCVKAFYTPDIVMYLDNINFKEQSNNIIFNIREDKESTFDGKLIDSVRAKLLDSGYEILNSSTIMKRNYKKKQI